MRRREFIMLLGGAAAVWPLAAPAQQKAMPVVAIVIDGTPEKYARRLPAFLRALGEKGFVEGHSVAIEYRWARGNYDLLPGLAADLVPRIIAE
jgi:putative ABC transport system substrate-binding protein